MLQGVATATCLFLESFSAKHHSLLYYPRLQSPMQNTLTDKKPVFSHVARQSGPKGELLYCTRLISHRHRAEAVCLLTHAFCAILCLVSIAVREHPCQDGLERLSSPMQPMESALPGDDHPSCQCTLCSLTDGSPYKHDDPETALKGTEVGREAQLQIVLLLLSSLQGASCCIGMAAAY